MRWLSSFWRVHYGSLITTYTIRIYGCIHTYIIAWHFKRCNKPHIWSMQLYLKTMNSHTFLLLDDSNDNNWFIILEVWGEKVWMATLILCYFCVWTDGDSKIEVLNSKHTQEYVHANYKFINDDITITTLLKWGSRTVEDLKKKKS